MRRRLCDLAFWFCCGGIGSSAAAADAPSIYATVCLPCHGDHGQGNEVIKAPSIAGLPAWYVQHQLGEFAAGRRGTHAQDTTGILMASVAKLLKPEQREQAAREVSALAVVPPPAPQALQNPSLEAGRVLYTERCAECHRYNGSGELTFGSAQLTGLPDWYLLSQIDKFKAGWRGTHPLDVNGAKMVLAVRFVETEQAKYDVVAFILSLNAPRP